MGLWIYLGVCVILGVVVWLIGKNYDGRDHFD